MAKWASNSAELRAVWESIGIPYHLSTRVLGVHWETEHDRLLFNFHDFALKMDFVPTTKRLILQATAQFYDPLGLFSPVSMVGIILFQDTWLLGLQWGELLPHDVAIRWSTWVSSLTQLPDISIPRWMGTREPHSNEHIHIFCDASESAYGAAVYIRIPHSQPTVLHLWSRARLAPFKKVTLQRLELFAALVGARLLRYICKETGLSLHCDVLWSDAKVVLGWLRGDPT